jgi:hypothetical protein
MKLRRVKGKMFSKTLSIGHGGVDIPHVERGSDCRGDGSEDSKESGELHGE